MSAVTPDEVPDPFVLLHTLRGLAACAWTVEELMEPLQRRRDRAARGEVDECRIKLQTDAEVLAEAASLVGLPAASNAVASPDAEEMRDWFGSRPALLLHAATGDFRHFESPAAWMASRGWLLYPVRQHGKTHWQATRAGFWRVLLEDPFASAAFHRCVYEAWEEYLLANEWQRATRAEEEEERLRPGSWTSSSYPMRAPSGVVYPMWSSRPDGGDTFPALDVALTRGGFDVRAELERGAAATARLVGLQPPPPRAPKGDGPLFGGAR